MSGQPWPPSLLPVLLPVLLACSQGGEPGPTTRARLDKQAAIAKAAAEESLRPPPPIAFGPVHLPALVDGLRLGMTPAALGAARPRAYPTRQNPDAWHEELGTRTSAHYTFHAGALYSVLLHGAERASEAPALLTEARRRWGTPIPFGGAQLFRAPAALVRVVTELGNLVVEVTQDRASPTVAR